MLPIPISPALQEFFKMAPDVIERRTKGLEMYMTTIIRRFPDLLESPHLDRCSNGVWGIFTNVHALCLPPLHFGEDIFLRVLWKNCRLQNAPFASLRSMRVLLQTADGGTVEGTTVFSLRRRGSAFGAAVYLKNHLRF